LRLLGAALLIVVSIEPVLLMFQSLLKFDIVLFVHYNIAVLMRAVIFLALTLPALDPPPRKTVPEQKHP
jgi:hypothetical protein